MGLKEKAKGFMRVKVRNTKLDKVEEGLLLHFKDCLFVTSLKSRNTQHRIKHVCRKRNLIISNEELIYIWEEGGKYIFRLQYPIDPSAKNNFSIGYETDDAIIMVKEASDIQDKQHKDTLMVVDEPGHMKSFLPVPGKLKLLDEFFVSEHFALSKKTDDIIMCEYSEGILYTPKGGIIL